MKIKFFKLIFVILIGLISFVNHISAQEEKVFEIVDEMPRFPGCEAQEKNTQEIERCANNKMLEFITKNLKYPVEAKRNRVEGKAVVKFTIEKTGNVRDINLIEDPGQGTGTAAVAVVELMNDMDQKWIPGKNKGQIVDVSFSLPVRFMLHDDPDDKDKDANDVLTKEAKDKNEAREVWDQESLALFADVNIEEDESKVFADDFEMTMEDGSKKKLSDFKGQVVYLSFWASWCVPCIKGFNNHRDLRKEIAELGIVLLNVSIDENPEKWKAAIAKHQPLGFHAFVPHDIVRELYQMYNPPRYEIVGKLGQFLYLSDDKDRNILDDFKGFLKE